MLMFALRTKASCFIKRRSISDQKAGTEFFFFLKNDSVAI